MVSPGEIFSFLPSRALLRSQALFKSHQLLLLYLGDVHELPMRLCTTISPKTGNSCSTYHTGKLMDVYLPEDPGIMRSCLFFFCFLRRDETILRKVIFVDHRGHGAVENIHREWRFPSIHIPLSLHNRCKK